jgi:hypothetical protein
MIKVMKKKMDVRECAMISIWLHFYSWQVIDDAIVFTNSFLAFLS